MDVTIVADSTVATHDDIRAFVRSCDGPFPTMSCIRSHGKDVTGDRCCQTAVRENCLAISVAKTDEKKTVAGATPAVYARMFRER